MRAALDVHEATAVGLDGAKRLFGAMPPNPIFGGIVVAAGLDRVRMFAELRHASERNLLALATGAVLAMSAGLLGERRFVLAPLARLAAAADRVGGGDLGSRADLGRRSGELREVGEAFNRISAALATREGERDSAEAARQAGEARLAGLLATTPAGVVEMDAEGCFYANAAAEQILGAEPGALVGRRYDDPAWDITAQDGSPIPLGHLPAAWTLRGEAARDYEHTLRMVEDEDGVRAVAAERLRELGYEVLEAADGPAALRLLRPGRRVDLLVSDVGLPGGMNGRQVADTARERRPGLPVLFITGYAGSAFDGRLAPGMEVITKPFALEALAARVQAMLEAAPVR